MGNLFHIVLYQPFLNALVLLYESIPGRDFGVAVILLTTILRFIMFPLSAKAFKAQKALSLLQPKVQELQEKLKNNKEEFSRKLFELYKQEKVNPFASLLPLLVQFPILIALYQVFSRGLADDQLSFLYSWVTSPGHIDPSFFGLVDLSARSIPIALLAALFQFIQGKQAMSLSPPIGKNSDMARALQGPILYIIPLITGFFASQLPSALGLYWITTSLFSIWQQWHLQRRYAKKKSS
ncbi:MAG: membrane protein insertase YidC [Candidatus Wildermuthbacteria bacterium]|nr:membrane protein insertase YidC [Candidatus Wildermuthbacteria bacterium]